MTIISKSIQGGEFLIRETSAQDIFIPEEFSEEQKMMAQACQDFIDTEITPNSDAIDSMKNPDLVPAIFKKAGELGWTIAPRHPAEGLVVVPEEGGVGHRATIPRPSGRRGQPWRT